jgi:hypothetical protein
VVRRFVRPEAIRLVALGGSIPLGIATSVSDVDFLVVGTSAAALERIPPSRSEVLFRGHPGALILAECVTMVDDVEVDVQIVSADCVSELFARICRGQSAFIQEELVILSRLANGWPLVDDGVAGIGHWQLPWQSSLHIYCATRDYTFALKELEDAREAVHALPPLSLHLGRRTVEYGIRAYLASRGYAALGSKWMRLVLRANEAVTTRVGRAAAGTLEAGVSLLLSGSSDPVASDCSAYLDQVGAFLETLRGEIEKDPTMRVAFRVCPQIHHLPQRV